MLPCHWCIARECDDDPMFDCPDMEDYYREREADNMKRDEAVEVLLNNRPERPRSLDHKKLQSAIDTVMESLSQGATNLRKYEKIESVISEWRQDELRGRPNIDANYFYRILDVILETPE